MTAVNRSDSRTARKRAKTYTLSPRAVFQLPVSRIHKIRKNSLYSSHTRGQGGALYTNAVFQHLCAFLLGSRAAELNKIIRMSSLEHVSRVRRLYKLIFRVHRALPPELRVMGDNYARDEFKRHKKCNPEEAKIFLNEWTDYAITLAKQMKPLQQVKKKKVGEYLDPQMLNHMTDEQIVQLYELHKAATEATDEDIHKAGDKK